MIIREILSSSDTRILNAATLRFSIRYGTTICYPPLGWLSPASSVNCTFNVVRLGQAYGSGARPPFRDNRELCHRLTSISVDDDASACVSLVNHMRCSFDLFIKGELKLRE